jgi:hypothetical protein
MQSEYPPSGVHTLTLELQHDGLTFQDAALYEYDKVKNRHLFRVDCGLSVFFCKHVFFVCNKLTIKNSLFHSLHAVEDAQR